MTRTERIYYIVSAGYALGGWFMGPVYPLFLLSRGLDLFQMNVVLGTYLIAIFLFEVPTGAVADYFGRKISFLASCAVRMVAFVMYGFADSFADCLVAEVIDAIGTTMASGALDAWAIDGMHAEGDRRPTDRVFARAHVILRAMMVVGGVAGGYIAAYDWSLPWFIAAGMFALTGILGALFMYDDRRSATLPHSASRTSLLGTITAGLHTVRRSPVLVLICVVDFTIFCAGVPAHLLWQPRVQELTGQGVWLMGWIWAGINVGALVGSALIPRLLSSFHRHQVLSALTVWRTALLLVAAWAISVPPIVAAVLLQEMCFGIIDPLMRAWTNEHTGPDQRATVLSVASMFGTLGGAVGLVAMGLVARSQGIPAAWLCSAAVFTLAAPMFLFLGRVSQRTPIAPAAAEPRAASL